MLNKSKILGFEQTFCTLDSATALILKKNSGSESSYFCISNTYQIILGLEDEKYSKVLKRAKHSIPDSAILGFCGKLLGHVPCKLKPFRGYDLLLSLLEASEISGINIGFYGGTEIGIKKLLRKIEINFPNLKVNFAFSPPFRKLYDEEFRDISQKINDANIDLLLVGIGCPKQENFMFDISKSISSTTMVGVGAAFDFFTGDVVPSHTLVHRFGFEWLYRLAREPRRLFKRYAIYNFKFIFYFSGQLFKKIINIIGK